MNIIRQHYRQRLVKGKNLKAEQAGKKHDPHTSNKHPKTAHCLNPHKPPHQAPSESLTPPLPQTNRHPSGDAGFQSRGSHNKNDIPLLIDTRIQLPHSAFLGYTQTENLRGFHSFFRFPVAAFGVETDCHRKLPNKAMKGLYSRVSHCYLLCKRKMPRFSRW